MIRVPFQPKVPVLSGAAHEAYVTRELAKLGLRRGRRFRTGIGWLPGSPDDAHDADAALRDALAGVDRLLGRGRR